jgi:8-amino-7-oxononanoate synthase
MTRNTLQGLSSQIKNKLIHQSLERRLRQVEQEAHAQEPALTDASDIPEQYFRFALHPGYQQLRILNEGAAKLGLPDPFFKMHEGAAGAYTTIDGKQYLNYSSYNYLGLCGDPRINEAAKAAIDRYGTSVSASRLVSGERPIHRLLEEALARFLDADDAIVFVSGHAANVTTIGYLFGPRDLILHDELIHNSVLQGIQLSGAKRLSFPHNDWMTLDQILKSQRRQFERVLIVVEGVYSMDGDCPELPRFIEIKKRHCAFLMVDEAHSLGVMGKTGRGIREHFNLRGRDVDIWMGTLSKSLAGCGGYIAGETALVEHLKFLAPGFLYSVGMSPPVAAASLTALECMKSEPERVATLQQRGQLFLEQAKQAGIDAGVSVGLAIIPAIVGSSVKAIHLSAALFEHGINVQPIIYPAVPEKAARLRFFISCQHTVEDIIHTVGVLKKEINIL